MGQAEAVVIGQVRGGEVLSESSLNPNADRTDQLKANFLISKMGMSSNSGIEWAKFICTHSELHKLSD